MRLKTAPRVIIGLAVVSALAYGVNYYIDTRPKSAPVDVTAQPPVQPAEAPVPVQAPVQVVQPSAPVQPQPPMAEAPQPAPARTQQDSALDALLKGGTK